MTVDVLLGSASVPISKSVFTLLLDNSVAGTYVGYQHALARGTITFTELTNLARHGEIPVPLFFAPLPLVERQVAAKTLKLLAGVSKDTFSIGSRSKVQLRDIELIVKDLVRKQELLKRHDESLGRNRIIGCLSRTSVAPDDDAARLMSALGLSHERLRSCRKKDDALDLFIDRLEANQVLVSRSVQNYMPQRLTHVEFSGMTIRDNKVPYIFLAGGDHGDQQEPVGRTIFTLALLTVLIARRIFAPMTWDGGSVNADQRAEYDIAGAMLMPAAEMRSLDLSSLDKVKQISDEFKVTASAITVRVLRLELIEPSVATAHLDELRREYFARPQNNARSPIRPENAVRKYNGRELSRRMLGVLDASRISPGEFCRAVCLNYIRPGQINDLRKAVG